MKLVKTGLIFLLMAVIITACGGEDTTTADPVEQPTDGPTAEPTPTFESAQVPEGTTPLDTIEFVVDPALVDVTWEWIQRTDNGGQNAQIIVPEPEKYTLLFNVDATFNATIDCNTAGGAYATDGNGNIFMELGPMTRAACSTKSLADDMINMFGPAQSYVYEDDGNTLIFKWAAGGPWDYYQKSDGSSEAPATAAESEDSPLVGTVWNLTSLNGRNLVPTTSITAEFSEDGKVGGSSGCNNYSAAYEVDGNNITFKMSPVAMTMMACPDPIMNQETAYLAALEATMRYEISGDELVFYDAAGNPIAVFAAVSQDLAGSSWDVISYNNGKGGVVTLIIGTQITAVFAEDGQLAGNAGCNDYFGPYEADGENISMGPFGTTRMACPEPEGIMEQESAYLAALETAATYKIDGNTMNMRTAEGATVANFQRLAEKSRGATVSGMVTNVDNAAIPEGATTSIQIQDTSLADVAATVMGEQIIENPGAFPIAYEVSYDPAEIIDNHTYTMRTRITDADGSLLFINDTAIPVITNDNPTEDVEIPVIQVGG